MSYSRLAPYPILKETASTSATNGFSLLNLAADNRIVLLPDNNQIIIVDDVTTTRSKKEDRSQRGSNGG